MCRWKGLSWAIAVGPDYGMILYSEHPTRYCLFCGEPINAWVFFLRPAPGNARAQPHRSATQKPHLRKSMMLDLRLGQRKK